MCPPAKIMTISAEPMARGAITPGVPGMTVQPMVSTRKKVPMNSAIYFFISTMQTALDFELGQGVSQGSANHRGFFIVQMLCKPGLGATAGFFGFHFVHGFSRDGHVGHDGDAIGGH